MLGRNISVNAGPPVPAIPHFSMTFTFDEGFTMRPIDVYQVSIQMMYDLAQWIWTTEVKVVDSKEFGNYKTLILFVNLQPPNAHQQLQVMHCVASLYRAIVAMTDGVLFFKFRSRLSVGSAEIGGLSITPIPKNAVANTSNTDSIDDKDLSSSNNTHIIVDANSGQVKDPENHLFVINYHFLGKSITAKEVSLAVLEALTAAAPYPRNSKFSELSILSPDGGCAIIIEEVSNIPHFTYHGATRALKLLYQLILVPQKRFGDIYLEITYDAKPIGELRMLRTVSGMNTTNIVAQER